MGETVKKIWDFLKSQGLNDYGVAGLMGNLFAESGLRSNNLQNSYEKKLGMTDESYTKAVDNGSYTNFIYDKAGYGLAQWTFWSRKKRMYYYIKKSGASIGDMDAQLEFLAKELKENYSSVWNTLKSAKTVLEASNAVLFHFEAPADQGASVQKRRCEYGQKYYDEYAQRNGGSIMSNSSLVTYTKISPNKTSPRNHKIDTITIHCMAGDLSVETCGNVFAPTSRQASSNYGIGSDGRIGMYVEEKDRSWCSSNGANDHRAITIEVANDGGASTGWHVSDKAMESLIKLCADICKRNGIKKLLWKGDKSLIGQVDKQNMTVHRWFAAKACPGDYLYGKHSYIAEQVNKLLGSGTDDKKPTEATVNSIPDVPFSVRVLVPDLNYRTAPSMSGQVKGQTGKGTFTIVEVKNGWGKLKSGAGWIYLENPEYVTILGAASQPQKKAESYTTYTVQSGDSLWKIAAKLLGDGNRYKEIKELNGMKTNTIYKGNVLKIPAK